MTDQGTQPQRFEVRPTADTHFGWLRTRLSVERTLMAWVGTAMAPIGFGFTIVPLVVVALIFIGLFAFGAVFIRAV